MNEKKASSPISDGWINLNIGGKLFLTTKTTLLSKDPNSMLARMFAADRKIMPSFQDTNGAYMIDRSGVYFEPILNYLRTGQLIIDHNLNLTGVLEEAKFYGLEPLINELEELIAERDRNVDDIPLSRADIISHLLTTVSKQELRFQGVNLEGINLSKLDLRNINFKYANLSHSNLSDANLSGCCFERANISFSNLEGAQLINVKMSLANLERCNLKSCNFEDPACSLANCEGVNLLEANLEGSNMAFVNLRVATLKYSNLKGCDLRGAIFAGADLEISFLKSNILVTAQLLIE